jgi:hypothetical protein
MRRWGRVPICKASRPDHELGIQTHTILLRKERKEVILWAEADLRGSRVERPISKKRKERLQLSGSKEN